LVAENEGANPKISDEEIKNKQLGSREG
jgi:hypothetical protein